MNVERKRKEKKQRKKNATKKEEASIWIYQRNKLKISAEYELEYISWLNICDLDITVSYKTKTNKNYGMNHRRV